MTPTKPAIPEHIDTPAKLANWAVNKADGDPHIACLLLAQMCFDIRDKTSAGMYRRGQPK